MVEFPITRPTTNIREYCVLLFPGLTKLTSVPSGGAPAGGAAAAGGAAPAEAAKGMYSLVLNAAQKPITNSFLLYSRFEPIHA